VLALHNCYTDNLVAFGIFFAAIDVEMRILTGSSTNIEAGAEEMSDYTIPLDVLSRELDSSGL
jgi:hypothetical protein